MDDLISRQAAIDALRKMQTYKLFSGDDMLLIDQAGAQTELMLLPPAQPAHITSRWIPCSERRLPENDEDVLVQMDDGSMMVDYRTASSNGWFWAELDDEPVAWMPLPEPYKEVTE